MHGEVPNMTRSRRRQGIFLAILTFAERTHFLVSDISLLRRGGLE